MSASGKSRRASTLLKTGRGHPARPMVESRPLYNYWAILMPYFRGVLLPPHNRSDESIQWTWTEAVEGDGASAAELATIRKRLAGAQQSFADSLEDEAGTAAKVATMRATAERMEAIVGALVALPDPALGGFVARTDRGLLLHSWGLTNPLPLQYLDADFELAGRVLVAAAPAAGQEVLLLTADGRDVGRTTTDAAGHFEFSKIGAGSYRVRAVSRPPDVLFPEKGEMVEILGASITDLEICSEDRSRGGGPASPPKPSGRPRGLIVAAVVVILAIVAFFVWRGRRAVVAPAAAGQPSAWDVNRAPASVAQHGAASPDEVAARPARVAMTTEGRIQTPPRTTGPRTSVVEFLPAPERSRANNPVVAQAASGLPGEQSGMPAGSGGLPGGSAADGAGGPAGGGQAGGQTGDPAGGAAGNTRGSPGAAARTASASSGPTASTFTPPTPPVSPAVPAALPPATDRTKRPPAGAGSRPSGTESPAETETAVGADTPTAKEANAKVPAREVPAQAAAVAKARPETPGPAARPVAEDLLDPTAPSPEESEEQKQRDQTTPSATQATDEQLPVPPATSVAASAPAIRDPVVPLVVGMKVRASPWRPSLLRDTIVPTLPTRVGQDDALAALRSRLLVEKRAARPAALREGGMIVGVRLDLSALPGGSAPRWAVVSGAAPVLATTDATAAEIGWRAAASGGEYALLTAEGRLVAQVSVDPQAGIRLACAGELAGWPWVGLECSPGEAARLGWQVLGAGAVPASWTEDGRWQKERGRRLDLKFPTDKDETLVVTLALADATSGWALTSKLELRQKLRR